MHNVPTAYHEEIKEAILFRLANEVMTSRELEAATGYAYPSLRKAMVDLEENGKIVKFDNRSRNARYTIAPDDRRPTKIIPSVMFKQRQIPLVQIYKDQGLEDVAVGAVNAILQAWTTVAITGRRLHEGMPDTALVKRVNRERVNLTNARENLEQLTFICNQMLSNEKLWDPVYLSNFPDDPDWQSFLPHLEELYSYYFPSDTNG